MEYPVPIYILYDRYREMKVQPAVLMMFNWSTWSPDIR